MIVFKDWQFWSSLGSSTREDRSTGGEGINKNERACSSVDWSERMGWRVVVGGGGGRQGVKAGVMGGGTGVVGVMGECRRVEREGRGVWGVLLKQKDVGGGCWGGGRRDRGGGGGQTGGVGGQGGMGGVAKTKRRGGGGGWWGRAYWNEKQVDRERLVWTKLKVIRQRWWSNSWMELTKNNRTANGKLEEETGERLTVIKLDV